MSLAVAGLVTGLISGLFCVVGGSLMVPALLAVIEAGIHRAVTVSLVIITVIGISGARSSLIRSDHRWQFLIPFIAGSIFGIFFGRIIAGRIAGPVLQSIFAGAILPTGANKLIFTFFVQETYVSMKPFCQHGNNKTCGSHIDTGVIYD